MGVLQLCWEVSAGGMEAGCCDACLAAVALAAGIGVMHHTRSQRRGCECLLLTAELRSRLQSRLNSTSERARVLHDWCVCDTGTTCSESPKSVDVAMQ